MRHRFRRLAQRAVLLALSGGLVCGSAAEAAVLRATVTGCKTPEDASKAFALGAQHKTADIEALTARRACLGFTKGLTVDIDEKKAPMTCIRLTGDLECWWVPSAVVDEYPGSPGHGSGGGRSGGHRHGAGTP